jgi:uncharacterized protein YigE (DUF2233 family)
MKLKMPIFFIFASILLCAYGCSQEKRAVIPKNANIFENAATLTLNIPEQEWKEASPGISYRYFHIATDNENNSKDFFVVRVNPKKYVFEIYQNHDQKSALTIKEIHQSTNSLLTFNGGFFTEEFKPTGLLISNGQIIHTSSTASLLNGIFAISATGTPHLFTNKTTINEHLYPFAIQNGPVLIDGQGKISITKDTGNSASRTAIGIDKNNNVVLIILKQSLLDPTNSITLYNFAHILKEASAFKDLNLRGVLNLDGGASTGLMVEDKYFPELDRVQNAIIVKARQQ